MNKFVILSAILFLFSCQEIKFKEPQPIDTPVLNSFPTELIGRYYDFKNNDTLIVNQTTFSLGNNSSLVFIDAELSDTVVLKTKDQTYYLNLYDKEKKLWSLVTFKLDVASNLHVSLFIIENDEQVEKIKAITPLQPILDEEKEIDYYIAQPTESELKKIIDQELFPSSVVFNRINL